MASCNMASAASGFALAPTVATNTNSTSKPTMLFFSSKNNNKNYSRLVVRSAEEGASPPAATTEPAVAEAPKPKPPPIGPKRGTKVSYQTFPVPILLIAKICVEVSGNQDSLYSSMLDLNCCC